MTYGIWSELTLVTGASGFVGSHLVDRLLERGVRVRGLVRSEGAAQALAARGGEAVVGDVRDRDAVCRAVVGCKVVFHLAAILPGGGDSLDRVRQVNVGGTRLVAFAAVEGEWIGLCI